MHSQPHTKFMLTLFFLHKSQYPIQQPPSKIFFVFYKYILWLMHSLKENQRAYLALLPI